MRRYVSVVLVSCFALADASGATITVRQDGYGDYKFIQPALDAAADGDTIRIGPGIYTESTAVRFSGWAYDVQSFAHITSNDLVMIGAGVDETVLGPSAAVWDNFDSPKGVSNDRIMVLRLSDLTVRNCHTGVFFWGTLIMERCKMLDNFWGAMWTTNGSPGVVRDCSFWAPTTRPPIALSIGGASSGMLLEKCDFVDCGVELLSRGTTVFRSCTATGRQIAAITPQWGALCVLWDCHFANVAIGVHAYGSRAEIHDSSIEAAGSVPGGLTSALVLDQHASAFVEGSKLIGGSSSVVHARNADQLAIHGCDLIRGTGPAVRVSRPSDWGAETFDLTGNYWGTDDELEIKSWIIDSHDDSSVFATVLYNPFVGQSTPNEAITWGDLKAIFR